MNMIERVARAICLARGQDPDSRTGFFRTSNPPQHITFAEAAEPEAEAAIAAMYQPTEAMHANAEKLRNACRNVDCDITVSDVWRIMIDEALKPAEASPDTPAHAP